MNDPTDNRYFYAVLYFLFGNPHMPPLPRKEFIRAGLMVLCIRGVFVWLFGYCMLKMANSLELFSMPSLLSIVVITVIVTCIFLIPYLRVMHRRLIAIRFPCPSLLITATIVFLIICAFCLIKENNFYSDALWAAIYISIYLLLLPWPERHAAP